MFYESILNWLIYVQSQEYAIWGVSTTPLWRVSLANDEQIQRGITILLFFHKLKYLKFLRKLFRRFDIPEEQHLFNVMNPL